MDETLFEPSRTLWARGGKRAFDLVVALIALVPGIPLLAVAALAIKLTSRGPVFFSQVRAGRDGEPFRPVKLRTMIAARTPDPAEIVRRDHPDVTGVGRFLRRCKIDELPQLIHVLSGRMSLVGPRPTLPDQVARYDDFKRRRLIVRPGITGLAQVHGNTALDWDERIRYDVHYVGHCRFWLDIRILGRTVLTILFGEERFARPFSETFARPDPSS